VLDEVLTELWDKMQAEAEARIGRKIDDEIAQSEKRGEKADREKIERFVKRTDYSPRKKKLTLYFATGQRLEVSTFDEALLHPQLSRDAVESFSIEMECGGIESEMSVGTWSDDTLHIRVRPEKHPLATEIFGALRNWASASRPSKWLTRWRRLGGFQWWVLFVVAFFTLAVWSDSRQDTAKRIAKAEGGKLLQDGVNSSNQSKAVEILLRLSTEYIPPSTPAPALPHWVYVFLAVGVVIAAALSISPPGVVIGIGDGQKRVKRWRAWMRLASWTIPAFLFTNVLWPVVVSRLSPH